MENLICLDSSVLIDFFRKKKSTVQQINFWDNLFDDFIIVPYTRAVNKIAIDLARTLKRGNVLIDYKDLTIAATALHVRSPLATINAKHFKHIKGLSVISPDTIT